MISQLGKLLSNFSNFLHKTQNMKITILYRMTGGHLKNEAEEKKLTFDLSRDEYLHYKSCKIERKEDYIDLRAQYKSDEEFAKDIDVQEELSSLNYEVLQEALPEWCEHVGKTIVEGVNSCCLDGERYSLKNLLIEGCRICEDDGCDACL